MKKAIALYPLNIARLGSGVFMLIKALLFSVIENGFSHEASMLVSGFYTTQTDYMWIYVAKIIIKFWFIINTWTG